MAKQESGSSKTRLKDKYDVVVVGAGVAGAIIAKDLANSGKSVILLEAGRATSIRPEGYDSYVEEYQQSLIKVPNSPYPQTPNAPSPSLLELAPIDGKSPLTTGYMVYQGKMPFLSNYTRQLGGTTLHFLGTCIRMVPNDFKMQTQYGVARDWPITYESMEPFYAQAELEMGVSADTDEQEREGIRFPPGYEFPMRQIPKTYLDRWLDKYIGNMQHKMGPEKLDVHVIGTPAGRNGTPNPKYIDPRTNKPFVPQGAPYDSRMGQRCEGNSACVPICPVMAKYNALRTLFTLDQKGKRNLRILSQTVAVKVNLSKNRKRVTGIACKRYDSESGTGPGNTEEFTVVGQTYVIAANAIASSVLLLASDAANSSDQVGRNLMDHPYYNTWGLAPKGARLGVLRGPQITSEVPMRDGKFRKKFAAFRGDIRNGGWDFSAGSPYANVAELIEAGKFGRGLREQLHRDVQRQIGFGFQVEQLPDPDNRVTIDGEYRDQLGNYRPVLTYNIDDYTRRGVVEAKGLSDAVFKKVGGTDETLPRKGDPGNGSPGDLKVGNSTYQVAGSGHIVGTHCMGTDSSNSVTDGDMRTWDHKNLFVVGCGNMPTLGTSNPTLTAAALAYRAVAAIKSDLK